MRRPIPSVALAAAAFLATAIAVGAQVRPISPLPTTAPPADPIDVTLVDRPADRDVEWVDDHVRRIHMDFHTPEVSPETVVKRFDAERYVATLADAHVNSLVSFAKDHHGNAYYRTALGHRHAGLPDSVDMLGDLIAAGHARGMRVLAYFSVGWLTPVERAHPEWMERNPAGEIIGTGNTPKATTWNNICLNSPYLDEVVLPELTELCGAYDMDGLWLDILENNPCYCRWCAASYADEHDVSVELPDPASGAARDAYPDLYPSDSAARAFAAATRYRALERMTAAAEAAHPGLAITYNTAGRDPRALELVDFASIETHPGATWHAGAWTHALLTMKYLQRYGVPWESTTSRFIHGWGGWDDQPEANMAAVASRIVANGGVVNLGDQAYPDGTLDTALYERIGRVFGLVAEREEWALDAEPYPHVAVYAPDFDIYAVYGEDPGQLDPYQGAAKILSDRHHPFALVIEGDATDLAQYACVVLPETGPLTEAGAEQLRAYVRGGGKLLATGDASLRADSSGFALADVFGVEYAGPSPYSTGYLDLPAALSQNLRRAPLLTPAHFVELEATAPVDTLARHRHPLIEPRPEELFFFRHGELSPPGEPRDAIAIARHRYGEGEVAYAAAPLFTAFWRQHQWYLKDVVANLLDDALGVKRPVELEGPASIELYLRRKGDATVVHLVNYHLHRETNHVEEVVPVYDVTLTTPRAGLDPDAVEVVGGGDYDVSVEGDRLVVALERVDVYTQVVLR